MVDVFGRWQTELYMAPPVVDVRQPNICEPKPEFDWFGPLVAKIGIFEWLMVKTLVWCTMVIHTLAFR